MWAKTDISKVAALNNPRLPLQSISMSILQEHNAYENLALIF